MLKFKEKSIVSPDATSDQSKNTQSWARALFECSPLKRRKFKMLIELASTDFNNKECLDLGSDNGVISMLLRENGGRWSSADLIPETVEAIKGLVGERVFQIDGRSTPFIDRQFDLVMVVDILEHIDTDKEFALELARITKSSGTLVVNVPNPARGPIRWLRYALGQTDEKHGHVRAGYTQSELQELLGDNFKIEQVVSYGRVFSELCDTLVTGALDVLKGKRGKKGTVVTGQDLKKMKKSFKIFRLISPVLKLFVWLDELVPFLHGNMLIVRARRI